MVKGRPTITRRKNGQKFDYFLDGEKITDSKEIEYLDSLRVPPAWKDVRISTSKKSKILATGYDDAGRLQYIYSPAFRAKKEREKFDRILRFAEALPRMRRVTSRHLKHKRLDKKKVLACVVQLMDRAYFRVGNEVYAKENQSYGITTLRSKHAQVEDDTIVFDFTAKSGQRQKKRIKDKTLANIVKRLDELPGYEIFKYCDDKGQLHPITSQDVNDYIKEVMGEEFTAKDFRTWGGTLLASAEFASMSLPDSEKERKKAVTQCVKKVAKKLGNTPAIARSSYIDPRIIDAYANGHSFKKVRKTVEKMKRTRYMSTDERCVLVQLKKAAT